MKKLTEIIRESPIETATLATAFILEEAYNIGITRNLVVSGYESICLNIARAVDSVYHTIYNLH